MQESPDLLPYHGSYILHLYIYTVEHCVSPWPRGSKLQPRTMGAFAGWLPLSPLVPSPARQYPEPLEYTDYIRILVPGALLREQN